MAVNKSGKNGKGGKNEGGSHADKKEKEKGGQKPTTGAGGKAGH